MEIVVALISGGCAIAVCLISNAIQSNATRKLIEYRINKLEEKVDKHNNVVERTYKLEQQFEIFTKEFDLLKNLLQKD